jgi:hypothetical protein
MQNNGGVPQTGCKQSGTPKYQFPSVGKNVGDQPNLQSIPLDLKRCDQWVVWRIEIQNGKPTKVPYDANTRNKASTNDTSVSGSFSRQTIHSSDLIGITSAIPLRV